MQQQYQKGDLQITAVNAKLKRDTETFGTMDPYVQFKLGFQSARTKQAKDQGKTPSWNQDFHLQFQGEQLLTFELFDQDIGKDDFIAQGSYSLAKLFSTPGKLVSETVPLQYKGKDAGTINLQFNFKPENFQGFQNPQQGQGFQNPQQGQGFNQNPFNNPQQQQFPPQQGFNQNPYPQQGFNQPPQQGFNQPPQQGFNQPPQQGFNQPPQHGFNQPPKQGFNQPPQQGFNQQYPQQGFNQPPQQGFNQQQFPQQGFNQPTGYQNQNPQQLNGQLPRIQFDPHCSKCHGSGVNNKKGSNKPCGACYQHAGYCKKCCGTMWDQKKNKRCEKCHNGRGSSKDKKKDKKKK